MHSIYSFCHPMKMCFFLSCFHISEVKMLNIDLIRRVNLISHWENVKKNEWGICYFVSVLFFTVLLGLFFEGKPSSLLHMWVPGLLFAAMWAHQVFDVSIPLLQTQSCHGNTLGGSGREVGVLERVSKRRWAISPASFVSFCSL